MTIEAVTTVKIRAREVDSKKVEDQLAMGAAVLSRAAGCLNCLYTRRFSRSPEWILSTYWVDRASMAENMSSHQMQDFIRDIYECSLEVDFRCFVADGK
ncbi:MULTISPECIES: antibiotic biosynthesis monooxygenase [Pseudomonas]|uniref:ABM domain-containing protein n=1 Tax=Pseudomonas fulva TaxID=47880 RepID=A0A0D0L912_9PSED|nr:MULTISPECIES: antibiotic biosynthesis monooxygenase [Pseudomonas]KIQ06503.1 hypothetical protein RU08_00105 [Pseudomonas fulva]